MAKIYPEYLPASITGDFGRQAECKVYAALKTLPNKYTIFYSVHWQNHSTGWGASEGEADFIIVQPDAGIVVLEVKGGGIRYDAITDQWYSHAASGRVYPIKDPVAQGRRNHYALLEQLQALPAWIGENINLGHAVCFPDIYTHGQSLKPDLPAQIILDRKGLEDIQNAIPLLFQALFGGKMASGAPGPQRMRLIEQHLACSFELHTPLGVEIDYEDQRLIQLTKQQFYALSILGDRQRVAIGGCAGSGKTMLALEKARQFSELGLSVLLTCFNAPLAEYLKRRLPNVDIYHFHELCRQAAKQTNQHLKGSEISKDFFDVTLPEALLDAASEIGRVYDVIIVDEGQDFKDTYWIALESLLREKGFLYIFYDNNQNLYEGTLEFGGLITEQPFQLTQNCRNTQAIHNTVIKFHSNPQPLQCAGPLGRAPELFAYHGEAEGLRLLQKILHRLVVEEHIHPADIAILTPRGRETTRLTGGTTLGQFRLSPTPSTERNVVQSTSVFLFKGLEKRIVILAEIDNRTTYHSNILMYVGCSRARTHLIILHDVDAPDHLVSCLESGRS